ncbi:MAG: hypothetical protein ACR2NX_14565 [Chthoniobacterales bacterium]
MRRSVFFSFEPKAVAKLHRTYGRVKGFAIGKLPGVLHERLRLARRPFGSRTFTELVRLTQQRGRIEHVRAICHQRLAPDRASVLVREALNSYFRALDNGVAEKTANLKARTKSLALFQQDCNERTIRRIARRVDDFGGPELAPLDAYAPGKSIPHARSGKAEHHGAARPAAPLRPASQRSKAPKARKPNAR